MRVDELLSNKSRPLFSVELWPPRSAASETRLTEALERLSQLKIDFASITYGAGGSTRENTHALVVRLMRDYGLPPVAHLVTGAHTRLELEAILARYRQSGVDNLLALHGDPPLEGNEALEIGELSHAIDLARMAKFEYNFCVGVALHPNGHPSAITPALDAQFQAEKLAVADYAITQFFYKTSDYIELVDQMNAHRVFKPILPGIMAPTSFSTLNKMAEMSGTLVPSDTYERLAKYRDDSVSFQKEGTLIAIELAAELLEYGAPGIHVFTMNQANTTVAIYESLNFGS